MSRLCFLIIAITISSLVKAQNTESCNYELKGVILDVDTKEALPSVQIKIKGTERIDMTDMNGQFYFKNLCDSTYTLIISCFGYCDTTCERFHKHGKSPHIFLKQEAHTRDVMKITVARNKERGTESIAQQTVDKASLSVNPTQTLAAAISEIEGITFTSNGNNVQLPVIHGLYGNRVLVLNNGLKHGFQNWGTDHAPEIDIASANKVTLIKGAAGVRYGPEALGGAIIVEADPLYLNEPFKGQVRTGYQTNGRGYFANSNFGAGGKKWSYHMGASYTRIGDVHTPDYSLTNTGKEEISGNGGIRYRTENWDFKVYYSFVDQNLALLRSSIANSGTAIVKALNSDEPVIINPFSYEINEPNQLSQHHLAKTEIEWWYSDEAKLTLRLGAQLNKRKEFDVRRNAELPIIDLDLTTNDYQLEWKHPDWYKLDGLVGIQFFTQNNDNNPGTNTTPFIPNYNISRYSAFIVENLKRDKNTFELGIRLDHEYNNVRGRETNQNIFRDEYNFTNLTSSLGYVRQISENTTFRTNFGTAWRTPNMAELYSFGQHGFKTTFGLLRYYNDENGELSTNKVTLMDERNLSPERGYKWTNEWQSQQKSNTYTLTAYANYIENFMFDRPIAVIGTIRGPMPVFIFDQANAAFIGADFNWQKKWSKSFNGNLGISYLWSKNLKKDEPLIDQPPISINYKLAWNMKKLWKFKSSKLSIRPSYTFEQFQAPRTVRPEDLIDGVVTVTTDSEIFDFKDAPSGYFLMEMNWGLTLERFDINFAVQNIFNARYRNYLNEMRYFADELGRNFLITVNYKLNTKPKQI